MKKTVLWVLIIAVAVVALGFGYTRLQARRAIRAAIEEIRNNLQTARAEYRDLEVVITGKGTIQPNEKKSVSAGIAGTVQDVLVTEGSHVQEGQTVLVLQNDSVRYQAEQAKLDLRLAEEALEEMLGPAGAMAKAGLELRQAETNLRTVADKVEALSPKSPIAGDVWSVSVSKGDRVKVGELLATVADTKTLTISTRIRQEDLHLVSAGAAVMVHPGGTFAPVPGTLSSIGQEGVAGSKGGVEFPLTIAVPNPGQALKAGMAVTVTCEAKEGRFLTWGGTTAAKEKVEIRAETEGTVAAVLVKEGSYVGPGDVIAVLENEALLVSYDQAKNAVEAAKQSVAACERQIEQQRLRARQAQVNVSEKEDALSRLSVDSPLTGTLISISKSVGDSVTANEALFQVASVEPLDVTIPVDELDVSHVVVGQEARVTVDAFPERTWEGRVTKIALEGQVKDGVTNYGVTVSLTSKELRLGMSASVTVLVSEKPHVLSVPVEAVTWDKGLSYVNKVEDGQITHTRVKVGVQNDLYAEIVSGLEEGDLVLIGSVPDWGGLRLPTNIPGMRVR